MKTFEECKSMFKGQHFNEITGCLCYTYSDYLYLQAAYGKNSRGSDVKENRDDFRYQRRSGKA